jgi:hypothetical protein
MSFFLSKLSAKSSICPPRAAAVPWRSHLLTTSDTRRNVALFLRGTSQWRKDDFPEPSITRTSYNRNNLPTIGQRAVNAKKIHGLVKTRHQIGQHRQAWELSCRECRVGALAGSGTSRPMPFCQRSGRVSRKTLDSEQLRPRSKLLLPAQCAPPRDASSAAGFRGDPDQIGSITAFQPVTPTDSRAP